MSSKTYGDPGTRARILHATWSMVEERGAGIRLADVAERAGVSRQAVYLHFGDRAGLLCALVEFMDEHLGIDQEAAHVFTAPTGVQVLERTMEFYAKLAPRLDKVARVLEAAQYEDDAVAAAWRNRMNSRQAAHRTMVQRISDEGLLADGWTIDAAAAFFYTITMPGPWRELTEELGWSADEYRERITEVLRRALIAAPQDDG